MPCPMHHTLHFPPCCIAVFNAVLHMQACHPAAVQVCDSYSALLHRRRRGRRQLLSHQQEVPLCHLASVLQDLRHLHGVVMRSVTLPRLVDKNPVYKKINTEIKFLTGLPPGYFGIFQPMNTLEHLKYAVKREVCRIRTKHCVLGHCRAHLM